MNFRVYNINLLYFILKQITKKKKKIGKSLI